MNFLGKIIYLVGFPFILLIIRNSNRVYGAIIFDNKLLVTKNFLGLQKDWRLPGGGLKKNESKTAGLIRELQEEVGIDIKEEHCSLLISDKKHRKNFYYSIFVCHLKSIPSLKIDHKEILEAKFISINTLRHKQNIAEPLEMTLKRLMDD